MALRCPVLTQHLAHKKRIPIWYKQIDWKLLFLKGVGHIGPKFQVEGDIPPTICARLDRPVNALQLCR